MSITVTFTQPQELVSTLLSQAVSGGPCSIESTNKVTLRKTSVLDGSVKFNDVFDGDIFVTRTQHVAYNWNYENAVNNQRKREGITEKFVSQGLPWGEWVEGGENKIITHKGEYYLRYYDGKKANKNNGTGESIYHYEDGTELTEQELELMKQFKSKAKPKSKTQGVEEEVQPRAIKINGLNRVTIGGNTYTRK